MSEHTVIAETIARSAQLRDSVQATVVLNFQVWRADSVWQSWRPFLPHYGRMLVDAQNDSTVEWLRAKALGNEDH